MKYDELINLLRNCASYTVEDCTGCPYQGGYKGTYCMNGLVTDAADAIEGLSKPQNTVHLCTSCKYQYPECPADTGVVFGRGKGNDNICQCADYVARIPRWIPVTERLPEQDGKYLTVYKLNIVPPIPWIEVCWFAKNLRKVDKYEFQKKKPGFYKNDSEYGYFEVNGITHWMPLPSPPVEE